MTTWLKNESNANRRRATILIYQLDGTTPLPAVTDLSVHEASLALSGTHHATITWITGEAANNGKTLSLAADGAGAGSLTVSGGAYTFHYQSGTTTMANMVTAGIALWTFSGHTPADVLTGPGDTQGPLAFAGGFSFPISLRSGTAYAVGAGTLVSSGVDGEWIYTGTQAEANVDTNEIVVRFTNTSYYSPPTFVAVDEGTIALAGLASIWEGQTIEDSFTAGDMLRLIASFTFGPLKDFRTNTQTGKSLDGSKTRGTVIVSAAGRDSFTPGDLTP